LAETETADKRISKSNTTLARGGAVDDDDLRRGRICSAPVSRSVPDGGSYNERNGRVTLTPAQVDAARISGVSLTTYAEQLLRLREEKLNGNYTGRP